MIPKLQNIHWRQFISELFSLCIEHLPNCYSVRSSSPFRLCHRFLNPDWSFREHLLRAHPTKNIFYQFQSIPNSECLIRNYSIESMLDTLEIIVKWLQVSVSECNRQTPQTQSPICV